MARYIDANKINYTMASIYWGKDKDGKDIYRRTAIAVESEIDELPTADVVEVKHGVWYKSRFVQRSGFRTVKDFLCNRCEKEYSVQQPSNLMNYCPYCGAKMDGTPKERGGEK